MGARFSSPRPRIWGLLPFLLLSVLLPPAGAARYSAHVDVESIRVDLQDRVRLSAMFRAETSCQEVAAHPARFALTGLTKVQQGDNETFAVHWEHEGADLRPNEGYVEVAWARTDLLPPRFLAEGTAQLYASRNPEFLASFSDRAHWFVPEAAFINGFCPDSPVPELHESVHDMERFRVWGHGIAPDPEPGETAQTPTASLAWSLLVCAGVSAGAFAWLVRSRRAGEG